MVIRRTATVGLAILMVSFALSGFAVSKDYAGKNQEKYSVRMGLGYDIDEEYHRVFVGGSFAWILSKEAGISPLLAGDIDLSRIGGDYEAGYGLLIDFSAALRFSSDPITADLGVGPTIVASRLSYEGWDEHWRSFGRGLNFGGRLRVLLRPFFADGKLYFRHLWHKEKCSGSCYDSSEEFKEQHIGIVLRGGIMLEDVSLAGGIKYETRRTKCDEWCDGWYSWESGEIRLFLEAGFGF